MPKTWLLANLLWFLPLFFMAGCLSASTQNDNSPQSPPDRVFVAIADVKCTEVLKAVRNKIQQDQQLHILKEVQASESTRFVLKEVAQPDRKWQATVVVDCYKRDPMVSRLSAEVSAQKQNQKRKWMPDPDTADLQDLILQKVTPRFK